MQNKITKEIKAYEEFWAVMTYDEIVFKNLFNKNSLKTDILLIKISGPKKILKKGAPPKITKLFF